MSAVAVFTKSGQKSQSKVNLPKTIFAQKITRHDLLQAVYLAESANARINLAHTKTRGEVRGGGRKPWSQKGTGRARFGSIRNPIWRGGGITFGPRGNENYTHKLSKTTRQQALKQALSLAVHDNQLGVIETFDGEAGRVKPTLQLLQKMGLSGKRVLLVVAENSESVQRATRNLPSVKAVSAQSLGVSDILESEHVVVTKKALELLESRLGDES